MTHIVTIVPSDQIWRLWEHVIPWVEGALEQGVQGATVPEILNKLLDGRMQLFAIAEEDGKLKAIAVTSVQHYSLVRVLQVELLGGSDMKEWVNALDEEFIRCARLWHCNYVGGAMRKGLQRVLEPLGFKPVQVVLMKEVDDVQQGRRQRHVTSGDNGSSRIPTAVS